MTPDCARDVTRYLVVNADDFGASTGINHGIVDCHTSGVVTSTSLMVTGTAAAEAAELSQEHADLAVGLHWDVWGEDERSFDLEDERAVRDEFARQLDAFHELLGRPPTHVDSHKHAHRQNRRLIALFAELVEPLGVPLRDDGRVRFVGDFYAQWVWRQTELELVSVGSLRRLLAEKVDAGWTELSCHPGYRSPDFSSVYHSEREEEVRTLTDAQVRQAIDGLGITLVSFADYGALHASR